MINKTPSKPDPSKFTGIAAEAHQQGLYSPTTPAPRNEHFSRFDQDLLNKAGLQAIDEARPVYGPGTESKRPTNWGKRIKAGAAATTLALGGAAAVEHFTAPEVPGHVQVVEPGESGQDLPKPEEATIHVVQPDETASGIAKQYTSEGEDYRPLSQDIQEAADAGQDPGLDPGDKVIVTK